MRYSQLLLVPLLAHFMVMTLADYVSIPSEGNPYYGMAYYLPDSHASVDLATARSFCRRLGGVIPHDFDLSTEQLLGHLLSGSRSSVNSFWLDIVCLNGSHWWWRETLNEVPNELWIPGENYVKDGVVVMYKDYLDDIGLYIDMDTDLKRPVVCQFDYSSRDRVRSLKNIWRRVPGIDSHYLRQMLQRITHV